MTKVSKIGDINSEINHSTSPGLGHALNMYIYIYLVCITCCILTDQMHLKVLKFPTTNFTSFCFLKGSEKSIIKIVP